MKKLLLFFVLFTAVFSVSAQTKEARLFEEFGNLSCEDLRNRLDLFLIELQNSSDSKGYVMVYEGNYYSYDYRRKTSELKYQFPVFGEATLLSQHMLQHLKYRKFPPEKYLFISGGLRENYTVQLWIFPKHAKPPIPTPTLDKIKYRKGKLLGVVCSEG